MIRYPMLDKRRIAAISVLVLIVIGSLVGKNAITGGTTATDGNHPQDLAANAEVQPFQFSAHVMRPSPTATPKPNPLPPMAHVTPDKVRMSAAPLRRIDSLIQHSIDQSLFPGAVVLVARYGSIVKQDAYGYEMLYSGAGKRIADPTPTTNDTIYDLASLSKLFTTTAVMKLVERGAIDLDTPVAQYIPEFAANGKAAVTVRQLLSHTSGLPDGLQISKLPGTREDRLKAVFEAKLKYPPGTTRLYSDVGFETLGALVERVTGMRLDEFVTREILDPLQMTDTMYNPPPELVTRIAATEISQPSTSRQMIRGQVHDPDAFSLDGVSGNAGIFSTARDLAVFAQMILNGGQYGGVRVLSEKTVDSMLQLQSKSPDGEVSTLGWDQNQDWYMGSLASVNAVGHTGYTGTSIVIDRRSKTIVILLTNRVHPTAKPSINATRRDIATAVAEALR